MSYVDRVKECGSPAEALFVIAASLDELNERIDATQQSTGDPDWKSWRGFDALISSQHEHASSILGITETEDGADVELAPPTDAEMQRRREFEAQYLNLTLALGGDEDWNETYAKGGPMWLYLGNRELLLSYPVQTRQMIVEDVMRTDPKTAEEMGRDLLKEDADSMGDTPPLVDRDLTARG